MQGFFARFLNDTDISGAPDSIHASDVRGLAAFFHGGLSPDPFIRDPSGSLNSPGSVRSQAGSGHAVHAPRLCDRSMVHVSQVSRKRRVSGENDEGTWT